MKTTKKREGSAKHELRLVGEILHNYRQHIINKQKDLTL